MTKEDEHLFICFLAMLDVLFCENFLKSFVIFLLGSVGFVFHSYEFVGVLNIYST